MDFLKTILIFIAILIIILVAVFLIKDFIGLEKLGQRGGFFDFGGPDGVDKYPVHENIITSVFWAGEHANNSNDFISNKASAWDVNWMENFGGEDHPKNRNGYHPEGFTPKENPFYFALPYNDFEDNGDRKAQAYDVVYWSRDKEWSVSESILKNRWIKITSKGLNAYAQWEDVGPFEEDDSGYVFGKAAPRNKTKSAAGLDVSPAVKDYLNLSGIDTVNWQFVSESNVPDGPWKEIVTTRNGG